MKSISQEFEVTVSDEQVAEFHEQGYLTVGRITTDEEVAWLRDLWDEVFDPAHRMLPGGSYDASRPLGAQPEVIELGQVILPELRFPQLLHTTYRRNAIRIAARLLAVDEARLTTWGHMVHKPARIGHETPLHQDEAFWDGSVAYCSVGAWLALDDTTIDNGCMQFIPRSHAQGIVHHHHLHGDPTINALVADGDVAALVPAPVLAGSATFHHPRTLHYTGPNRTAGDRRAYALEVQLPPTPTDTPIRKPWRLEEGGAP